MSCGLPGPLLFPAEELVGEQKALLFRQCHRLDLASLQTEPPRQSLGSRAGAWTPRGSREDCVGEKSPCAPKGHGPLPCSGFPESQQ